MKKMILAGFLAFWVAVCIEVPQSEINIMNDIVVSHQVWIQGAWDGKVSNSKARIIKKVIKTSEKEGTLLDFSDKDKLITDRLIAPGYKDRKKRGPNEE